jgi:glycosyltransferase involved in cell wall biosynthesis
MNTQPMRIAYLISKYPAVSHTFILREVLGLRERGIRIEVASINAGPPPARLTQVEAAEAASTFYIKAQSFAGALRSIVWLLMRRPAALLRGLRAALTLSAPDPARMLLSLLYLAEAAILSRWIQQRALSHLHVHFASQAATVALLTTYLAPVTLSISVHGPDEFYDVPGSFLSAKVARARFLVCISYFAQSQMMKVSPGRDWHKFEISRLGVDTAHFAPRPARLTPLVFEILCVGRLVETKGQQILIEAVAGLVRSGRPVHLTLVGGGPDRAGLEELVSDLGLKDNIRFTGAINQDHIQTFYAAADIFALASFAEGIPVVLMEAMAMEIPCVATGINGIPELIRDGVDGLLVFPSDVDGLAAAIARLIDEPELRLALGVAGRARIQQSYELSKSTDRLAAVFRSRLAQAPEQAI